MEQTRNPLFTSSEWPESGWRERALSWIDEHMGHVGMTRTGDLQAHKVRSWSLTARVPTTDGHLWFKAAAPVTAHEIAIYPLLAAKGNDLVLQPIAVDAGRGWILLPDGGPTLRDAIPPDARVEILTRIMPRYAEMQRSLMNNVPTLISLGVPDMRPNIMPKWLDDAMVHVEEIARDHGTGSDRERIEMVGSRRHEFVSWCETLAQSPVRASLDHSDLHGGNVLIGPDGDTDHARVYDWGDSVIAHPFASMLVLLRSVQDSLGADASDPGLDQLRDAYLEPFSGIASHSELLETMELACRVSKITRAFTWMHALQRDPCPPGEWLRAPLEWITSLFEPDFLS